MEAPLAEARARRWVRFSVTTFLIAASIQFGLFAYQEGTPFHMDETVPGDVFVLLGPPFLAFTFWVLWHWGLDLLNVAFTVVWILFGQRLTWEDWQERSHRALWTLPWATFTGMTLWLIYSIGHFGGWPADVFFVTLAYLIGACSYGTVLFAWYRAIRGQREPIRAE